MKILNSKFFLKVLLTMSVVCSLFVIENNSYAAPRAAIRGSSAARQPVAKASTSASAEKVETEETATTVAAEPAEEPEEETSEPIVNKSTQFDDIISASTTATSGASSDMAERIRQQRAAAAAKDAADELASKMGASKSAKNACDFGLRQCMSETCGKDFTKCATDGDTVFGDKLNKCRRDLTCTGEEFKLFTAEIKADRDLNVQLSSYNAVIDCGNEYNECIVEQCGATFDKCLGKAAEDKASSTCKSIATKCKEQDSGMPGRFGVVIGKLRENAEIDIKKDEDRMYALRDLMKTSCNKIGAMFDERTFDCVYTVNFYAGKDQETPMASRKRYAGDTFVCMQEWFGIDVTTFKENAYRETRAQKAASSAMLGAGVGTAASMITSGAISRGLDTQKAQKALDAAKAGNKGGGNANSASGVLSGAIGANQAAPAAEAAAPATEAAPAAEAPAAEAPAESSGGETAQDVSTSSGGSHTATSQPMP